MDGILSDPKKWNDAVQSYVQENFDAEEASTSQLKVYQEEPGEKNGAGAPSASLLTRP